MTTCLLCGKDNFNKASGCVLSRTYTHALGDWVCKLNGTGILVDESALKKSCIKRCVKLVIADLNKSVSNLSGVSTKITDTRIHFVVSVNEGAIRYDVELIEHKDDKSAVISKYIINKKAIEINIPSTSDNSFFISLVREAVSSII